MPTSVHIPKPLLEAVDRRARALKVSRNRFIVRVLEAEMARDTTWSEGFFDRLAQVEPGDAETVDSMLEAIQASRTSKAPRRL
jgi:metal-responsive CopG/Arc/MetJ family transcriptional regulator